MAITDIKTLKNWFKNLAKPTQEHFWAWMDSFWHKDEKIPQGNIEGWDKFLDGLPSEGALENYILKDATNIDSASRDALRNKLEVEDIPDNIGLVDTDTQQGNVYTKEQVNNLIVGGVDRIKGKKIAILGDSISTENGGGNASLTDGQRYYDYLRDNHNAQIYVNAVAGASIVQGGQASTVDFTVDSRWQSLNSQFTPDVILIFGGINDFLQDLPLGQFGDKSKTTSFYGALDYLYKNLLQRYGARIFHITPLHTTYSPGGGLIPEFNGQNYLADYVNAIEVMTRHYGIGFIDVNRESGITCYNIGSLSGDKIHIREQGHRMLYSVIATRLNEQLTIGDVVVPDLPPDTQPPSVPTNLQQLGATNTSINATWDSSTDNVALLGYKVYVDGVYRQRVSTNEVNIEGLSKNTTYDIQVLAIDSSENESAKSSVVQMSTTNESGEVYKRFVSDHAEIIEDNETNLIIRSNAEGTLEHAFKEIAATSIEVTTPANSSVGANTVLIGYNSVTEEPYAFYLNGSGFVRKFPKSGNTTEIGNPTESYGDINVPKGGKVNVEWTSLGVTISNSNSSVFVPSADLPNFKDKIAGGLITSKEILNVEYTIIDDGSMAEYLTSDNAEVISEYNNALTIKSNSNPENYVYAYKKINATSIEITTPVDSEVRANTVLIGYNSVTNQPYAFFLYGGNWEGRVREFAKDEVNHSDAIVDIGDIFIEKGQAARVEWRESDLVVSGNGYSVTLPYSSLPNFVPGVLGGIVTQQQMITFTYQVF